jgi:hypothetical protein
VSKLSLKSYWPSTLLIDDQEIAVRVRRLRNTEFDAFATEFETFQSQQRGSADASPLDADAKAKRAAEQDAWLRKALREYVVIEDGELSVDDRPVTDASELVDLYGGRADVAPQAVALIWAENHVPAAKKKAFTSLLVSALTSLVRLPEAPGDAPAPTAVSADPSASAEAEPVTANPPVESSGTTGLIPETEGAESD